MKPKIIQGIGSALWSQPLAQELPMHKRARSHKAQVADRIRKVEDGVDEFSKYLETRGDDARSRAQSSQNEWSDNAATSGKSLQHAGPSRSSEADKG